MFKPIKRATREKKMDLERSARKLAQENQWEFVQIESGGGYTAEFKSAQEYEGEFWGWAIEHPQTKKIEFAFGSGQIIFDDGYTLTDEDYYEVIGAGE